MKEYVPGKNPGGGGGGGGGSDTAPPKKSGGGISATRFGGYPGGSGGRLARGIGDDGNPGGCGESSGCGSKEHANINDM